MLRRNVPLLLLAILSLTSFSGCSENRYVRGNQSVATIAIGTMSAQRIWKVADKAREDRINAENAYREDAEAGLKKWRETSTKVDQGFDALVEAVVALKQGLDAAEASKGAFDVVQWVGPVVHAGNAIKIVLDLAGVRIAGLDVLLEAAGKLLKTTKPLAPEALREMRFAIRTFEGGTI